MDIMNARQAYEETKYKEEIIKFEESIGVEIRKAVANGKYKCEVRFEMYIPNSIRDQVRNKLELNGYKVRLPEYHPNPDNTPLDQARYYDTLTISWDLS